MKKNNRNKSRFLASGALKMAGGIAAAFCTLLAGMPAMAETSVSGQSDTIMRFGQSQFQGSANFFPAYEYLRFSVVSTDHDGGATSLHVGGWGRIDLGDRTSQDKYSNADLQYGYISYQGPKNNLVVNIGRQFVAEGVAAERVDGFYARNDFAGGVSVAAFAGASAATGINDYKNITLPGGTVIRQIVKDENLIYGGRITQSMNKYYTLGISALASYENGGARYREEEGVDIWLHPFKQLDVTGRSTYNSLTNGWMEHAYALSYQPANYMRLSADVSDISYKDFFYRVTAAPFSLTNNSIDPKTGLPVPKTSSIDPTEKVLSVGGSAAFMPVDGLSLVADYRNYTYKVAGDAHFYGAKAVYSDPETFTLGLAMHMMDGKTPRLRYKELRMFGSRKFGHLDLAADLINQIYDTPINGVRNVYTIVGGVSYEFTESLKLGADVDYSQNPDYNNEVKGLIKLTYAFDTQHAAERGAKSEKH